MPAYGHRREFASAAAAKRRSANRATVVSRRRQKTGLNRLKLNPTVAKLVDRRIDRKGEVHAVGMHYRRDQWNNVPSDPAQVNQRIGRTLADIVTASSRADREGAEVTLSSITIKGMITIPADDNVYLPLNNGDRADICFRLCCLSSKKFRDIEEVRDNWVAGDQLFSKLLKPAQTAAAPTGLNVDMWEPINREVFTVHYDKVFHMKRGVGYFPDITSTQGAAHMPAINKPFTIRLKCKNKKLYFNESSAVQPTNYQPFIVGWWSYSNGAAPSSSGVPFMEYYSQTYFRP